MGLTLRDRLLRLESQASFQELHVDAGSSQLPSCHARRLRMWLHHGRFSASSLAKTLQHYYQELVANARQQQIYLEDVSVLPNFAGREGRCHMVSDQHEYVAVGGTFDRLHQGHKVLLSCAAAIATKGLVIGISGEPLLREKAAAACLQSWGERARAVADFVLMQRPHLSVRIEELSDAFGPSLRPELGALVVSAETEAGGLAVNDQRRTLRLSELQLVVVPLVMDGDAKLSSSALRLDDQLRMAFERCWQRSNVDVAGTRWSLLLGPLTNMAAELLMERPEECERQLKLLAANTAEMALARCLEFLFVVTGPELLDVMAEDLPIQVDRLRQELGLPARPARPSRM